jgi:pyruvate dehydrogenase E1 component
LSAVVPARPDLTTLARIQDRVLWLAVSMVHHANKRRSSSSGVKVGGHQASSASMVSIMTALFFAHLRAPDRVSVKPHAGPVLHAINHLLGRLAAERLTQLRTFGGLQSYPSRLKDPDPVDYTTGSVGIGATATIWSSLASRYLVEHGRETLLGRDIALVGDAELDEGAVWEALVDPMVTRLGDVLWVVDVNRQSLDRVVPDIAAGRLAAMFRAAGWHAVFAKYGSRLREAFAGDGGDALEARLDAMSNEEYQHLLRCSPDRLRHELIGTASPRGKLARALRDRDDEDLAALVADLGGHDIGGLLEAFAEADAITDRPTVVFAYTIKGWGLPTRGHPSNHSALLSEEQWRELGPDLGADPDDPWAAFPPDSPEAQACQDAATRLARPAVAEEGPVAVPADLGRRHTARESTQQAFGRVLLDLTREAPDVAERIVTVSPDVASSTNLGGWINRVGIWNVADRVDWFDADPERLVRWRETRAGQHVEFGIAEVNLVGLLSELGVTWSRHGRQLLPIGTLYDPFVGRALEPWSFGLYAGGQSILVGTPSGVTLAPEGGAHQSVITPSIGLEQPRCVAWEPAFGQDLEWTLLAALARLGRPDGTSAYFRLSTRPLDQALAAVPDDPGARERRRGEVLAGGYMLCRAAGERPAITLVGTGAVMPEVVEAAARLAGDGVACDVLCLTSADLVFRAVQARRGLAEGPDGILDVLFPPARSAPVVTVIDGHPHTLAFLGSISPWATASLGVQDFGQSADVADLYGHFGIDPGTIAGAAWDLLDEL